MSVAEEYLANNEAYAATFSGPLPLPPSRHVAVVACMDARLNVYAILGLKDGEARVKSLRRIESSPFIPHTDAVRGFVFDVAGGRLTEVK
jgi:carbonic anhydrase